MRLITLNTWANRLHDPLIDFLKREAPTTDVFCFQEVFHTTTDRTHTADTRTMRADSLKQLQLALGSEFQYEYAPVQVGFDDDGPVDYHLEFGIATFIRRDVEIVGQEIVFVYRDGLTREAAGPIGKPRCVTVSKIRSQDGKAYAIINFHGLWQAGTNKQDNADRLEQSRRLREVIDRCDGPVILAGDFNLLPDGQSMAILEQGMKNLIKEYGITSTRSSHYAKPIRLADYILVSPEIEVKDFKVLEDEVSDHLPLVVDWSVS